MPLKSDWSNSEEENDFKKQNEEKKEIEDWDGDIQKQKELEKQEHKNSNIKTPLSSPKFMPQSMSNTDETEIFTPQLTNTLVTSRKKSMMMTI